MNYAQSFFKQLNTTMPVAAFIEATRRHKKTSQGILNIGRKTTLLNQSTKQ